MFAENENRQIGVRRSQVSKARPGAPGDPANGSDPSGRAAAISYARVNITISVAPVVIRGLQATAAAIACALVWEGTKTHAETVAGPFGTVTMVAPCVWMGKAPTVPLIPPFPLPISTPADPDWPQKKFDRCRQLEDGVQEAKDLVGSFGGCRLGMTASELAVRAAAWAAEVEARKQLIAECFPDPDTGHQTALNQAEDALQNCQEIPPIPGPTP